MFVRQLRLCRQLVLDRAKLFERVLQFERKDLIDDANHRFEAEAAGGEIDLTCQRHNVGFLARVYDDSFAVEADHRLKQGRDEAHVPMQAPSRNCTPRRSHAQESHSVSVGLADTAH